jgi:hypothetical protein
MTSILSREEVLTLLSQKAREGSTSAMIALERALRAQDREQSEIDEVIDRLMAEPGDKTPKSDPR